MLSQSSIALCITILTEHWETCAAMGRDLVRALQAVCAIPEFKPLWKDLLAGWPPGRGDPAETAERIGTPDDALGLVLSSRTPQPLLQSALTHGMEKELFFIMSQVRMGNHRRYQQWFQARHLAQKECESVISDLVRFICGVYHPTNQIIASDVVQRWYASPPQTFPA